MIAIRKGPGARPILEVNNPQPKELKVIIQDAAVLPALRELLGHHPGAARSGPEMLARMLYALRFLPARPEALEVAAALEALEIGGEVAA